jgi:hypothetical protein
MNTEVKAEHTPGPWYETTRGRNEYQSAICQESTGKTIALTYTSNDADARLIAAAPDALAVCELVLEAWHGNAKNFERKEPEYVKAARLVIAKAKGG